MEHFVVSEIVRHGYLAIFFLMVLESACLPVPSEVVMVLGGAMATGVAVSGTVAHLNLFMVGLIGAVGNLLGAFIAYWVGRTGGRVVVEKWGKYALIRHKDLDKAEAYFAKKGEWAVLLSRILPVVRTFISLPAGIAEMPQLKFALFTFIGSVPWTFALAYLGKVLAGNWQSVSKAATPISVVFGVLIVALIAYWYVKRRRQLMSAGSETNKA